MAKIWFPGFAVSSSSREAHGRTSLMSGGPSIPPPEPPAAAARPSSRKCTGWASRGNRTGRKRARAPGLGPQVAHPSESEAHPPQRGCAPTGAAARRMRAPRRAPWAYYHFLAVSIYYRRFWSLVGFGRCSVVRGRAGVRRLQRWRGPSSTTPGRHLLTPLVSSMANSSGASPSSPTESPPHGPLVSTARWAGAAASPRRRLPSPLVTLQLVRFFAENCKFASAVCFTGAFAVKRQAVCRWHTSGMPRVASRGAERCSLAPAMFGTSTLSLVGLQRGRAGGGPG